MEPFSLLSKIKLNSFNATLFGIQIQPGLAFIGASPEILFTIRNNQIFSEAIAGTRPRGNSGKEDLELEKQLISSKKDRYEHALVVQEIEKVLNMFCKSIITDNDISVLKLKRVLL